MSLTIKISELKTLLASTIVNRIPVLITGAPGIGKSDAVDQAATAAGADLILSHPAVADPTDAKGLPFVVNGEATFLPFGELSRAVNATKRTVWFLDDLGQASPAVQASYMQLLLARRVNGHVLSDLVTFVAATNRRTDRAGVSGILEPVKSRFGTIVELAPDVDEWISWAIDNSIAPEIIAFLRFKPDLLSAFTATADLTNTPTPRTWHSASRVLGLNLAPSLQHIALSGSIGEGAAVELSSFITMYRSLPDVDQILINPAAVDVPTNTATLYALAGALAHRTNDQTFGRVAQFMQKMVDAGKAEFAALVLRDAMQRAPSITKTTAFVKLATSDLGNLISGKV